MTSVILFGFILLLIIVWAWKNWSPFGWSQQKIYDHVKRGLLDQRAVSKGEGQSACRYRGENGRMCAAGFLIPNSLYDKRMEYNNLRMDAISSAIQVQIGRKLTEKDYDLLAELMTVHDAAEVDQWANALAAVAHKFGLRP